MRLERSPRNPILEANPNRYWESGAVFNCGATLGPGEAGPTSAIYLLYRAVPQGYTKSVGRSGYDNYISAIGCAFSEDGEHFQRYPNPVLAPTETYERWGCEDARVTRMEIGGRTRYLITYTALSAPAFSKYGNRVALAISEDLQAFHKRGVVIPHLEDKDAVIFPEPVGGRIAMLHRVLPNIQILYWDDLEQMLAVGAEPENSDFWRAYQASLEAHTVMRPVYEWEAHKIGAGPPPIKTEAGWLLITHGVDADDVYRAGAALLDLEDPSRVIARLPYPILEPSEPYERVGDVPNVVFPVGAVVREGRLYVYYGGADHCCCLATADLDDLLVDLMAHRI